MSNLYLLPISRAKCYVILMNILPMIIFLRLKFRSNTNLMAYTQDGGGQQAVCDVTRMGETEVDILTR